MLCEVEIGGLLELAGCQPSSEFSKKPCVERIIQKVTEQDTRCPPLSYARAHAHTHTERDRDRDTERDIETPRDTE